MSLAFDMSIPEKFAQALHHLHPDGAQHAAAAALRLYLDLGELGVKALQARAKYEGRGEADVILNLLANPPATTANTNDSATTMTSAPRRARTPRIDNQARDARIAQEYFDGGITYARLAAKHGLSTVRVTQIVTKAREMQRI